MKLVGYVRVSTEEQAEHGVSLAAQRERLAAYCSLYDHELVAVHEDAGLSAKSLDRPGLQAALAALGDKTADGLVVTKLDRLTRSVVDLGALLKDHFGIDCRKSRRSELISVGEHLDTGTAAGEMVINMLCTVAQWERRAISERTVTALSHKRSRGERVSGQVPYGWQLGEDRKHLEPCEAERRAIARARQLRQHGSSLRAIGAQLAAEGHPTRNGSVWRPATVACLLRSADDLLAVPTP